MIVENSSANPNDDMSVSRPFPHRDYTNCTCASLRPRSDRASNALIQLDLSSIQTLQRSIGTDSKFRTERVAGMEGDPIIPDRRIRSVFSSLFNFSDCLMYVTFLVDKPVPDVELARNISVLRLVLMRQRARVEISLCL